jgi:hypothetical protein
LAIPIFRRDPFRKPRKPSHHIVAAPRRPGVRKPERAILALKGWVAEHPQQRRHRPRRNSVPNESALMPRLRSRPSSDPARLAPILAVWRRHDWHWRISIG